MRFALITKDKPGHIEVRKANRDAHLAYIAETGVVEMAGPFGRRMGRCAQLSGAQFHARDEDRRSGFFLSLAD